MYSYEGVKDEIVLGELLMPMGAEDDAVFEDNQRVLLQRLNEPDVFDSPPVLQSGDRLLICIQNGKRETKRQYFGFEWQNAQWRPEPYDTFEWLRNYDEVLFGKLKDASDTTGNTLS